jgi:hypothetical protein
MFALPLDGEINRPIEHLVRKGTPLDNDVPRRSRVLLPEKNDGNLIVGQRPINESQRWYIACYRPLHRRAGCEALRVRPECFANEIGLMRL